MPAAKNATKSKRPGKKRLSAEVEERLLLEFKSDCVRRNITATEGIHRAIENYVYGEAEAPVGLVKRKERNAKISPIRDARCLMLLLKECGRILVAKTDISKPGNFELLNQLLFSIKRLLKVLEDRNQL